VHIKGDIIPVHELHRLIKGCVAGDRSCQKEMYELYSPQMMTLCLRYSKNREEAEEVLQDGFLQLYKYIKQYKKAGSFEGWLRKIMINCALQRYRDKINLYSIIPLSEAYPYLTTDDDLIDKLSEKELVHLIQALPPAYRMVFNLYVFEGFKHREIAQLLHISEGTSKSNLSDARAILKKSISPALKLAQ
jgi:RNA polymerase sigma-70 factor (ECF subfamily)